MPGISRTRGPVAGGEGGLDERAGRGRINAGPDDRQDVVSEIRE
jgi:hypothetical protein